MFQRAFNDQETALLGALLCRPGACAEPQRTGCKQGVNVFNCVHGLCFTPLPVCCSVNSTPIPGSRSVLLSLNEDSKLGEVKIIHI